MKSAEKNGDTGKARRANEGLKNKGYATSSHALPSAGMACDVILSWDKEARCVLAPSSVNRFRSPLEGYRTLARPSTKG